MEFLFEGVLQVVGELLLQILFELLAECGFRSLAESFRRPGHPAWAAVGYILWGLIAGGVSLLILPRSTIRDPSLRLLNLVAAPLAVASVMVWVGKLRARKGQDLVRLDRFAFAFLFAFAFAWVRYAGAT